jgi:hypothetical protein
MEQILLDKVTGSQLVKKLPAFYGTRRFITAFTRTRHLSLFWARSIQFMPPYSTSWKSILILSSPSRPGSSQWSLCLRFPQQNPVCISYLPYTCYVPCQSPSWFDHPNNISRVQIIKLLVM